MSSEIPPLRLLREKIPAPPPKQAIVNPIASILVDTGLLHLDEPLDFLVSEEFDFVTQPGALVSVTFNRKRTQGIVIARKSNSSFNGRLRFISEISKDYPIISPKLLRLVDEVRNYYGGNRWDVLRFIIPQLRKRDKDLPSLVKIRSSEKNEESKASPDSRYSDHFWRLISQNPRENPQVRAYWSPPPAEDPFGFIVKILQSTNGPIILLLPDKADVDRMAVLLKENPNFNNNSCIQWHSELSKSEREANFLKVLSGQVDLVIGTRSAIFLPFDMVSLVFLWDEGSDTYSEKRSPYYHAREVAIMRANLERAHLVIGGYAPTLMVTNYLKRNYLIEISPNSASIRDQMPQIRAITNQAAPDQIGRIPTLAWQIIKRGLKKGPVLIQVPFRGYILNLTCSECFNGALCRCGGKLVSKASLNAPECFLCGRLTYEWSCDFCHNRKLRNSQIGDERILEEIGRAFPNQRVIQSNADRRILEINQEPAIVVATPGAEPFLESGYAAILTLNAAMSLQRATLNAEEEVRRRWFGLATMLEPRGELFFDVDYSNRNIQSLIRWDGVGASAREFSERELLALPPVAKSLQLEGLPASVMEVSYSLPGEVLISTPKPIDHGAISVLIRVTEVKSDVVVAEIFRRLRAQSARGAHVARVKIDPIAI